jgi:peroxiredoxin
VSDRLEELADAAVVLITFTRPRNLAGFRRQLGLRYPVLADETRAGYRAYGLGRGRWSRVWSLRTLGAYARLLRRGRRLHRPTQDTRQLGGDFVVDRDGRLSFVYRSERPDDRPAVDTLVAAVRSTPGGDRAGPT